MKAMTFFPLLAALCVVLAACAPATAPPAQTRLPGADTQRSGPPKSLTIALDGEPERLLVSSLGGSVAGGLAGNAGNTLQLALHQRLVTYDDRGDVHPQLASALPTSGSGSWLVRPDGTMQTTYKLRPNVTWHDGTPLTSKDFLFAWTMTRDPEIPVQRRIVNLIERLDTPDPTTLVIEWTSTYPFANAVIEEDLGPLPGHLLEHEYRSDKERFQQLPYWNQEFVGVGPYQLAEWQFGSHLTLKAYDKFYAGRAKIDTLVFQFIQNEPTAVANLLAGTVDGSIPRAVEFPQAMFVKSEWERAGKKPVAIAQSTHWRFVEVQFRAPNPREMVDVRVRRALLHALDRQAMSDVLFDGQSPIADSFIPPTDAKWEWVKDVAVRYEYDPRRAQELFAAVGWRPGGDGMLVNAIGEKVGMPAWGRGSPLEQRELAIMADYWKAAGVEIEQVVLSPAQVRDNRFLATYPALAPAQLPATFEWGLNLTYSRNCPSEQDRFAGRNRGCYQHADMDRTVDALKTAIEPAEQRRLYRDLIRLQTEKLAVLPLNFSLQVVLFREGVTGVKGDTSPRTSALWNVAEWDVVR